MRSDTNVQKRKKGAPDAARQAVFNTVELLENILLHLPPIKIFAVLRVCRYWQELIANSKLLRESVWTWSDNAQLVSFLTEGKPWGKMSVAKKWSATPFITLSSKPLTMRTSARLNPLLRITAPANSRDHYYDGRATIAFRELDRFTATIFEQPGVGTWRNLYLTDPPCTRVWYIVSWIGSGALEKKFLSKCNVANPYGVTLGNLVDFAVGGAFDVTVSHTEIGYIGGRMSVKEAIERFQTRYGRHEYPVPHFNCKMYWNGDPDPPG